MRNLIIFAFFLLGSATIEGQTVSRETDFNFDWKFTLVNDTTIPKHIPLNDTKWRDIRLPHDWSVEFPFDSTLEGCTGYLPGGVGIYQKHFKTPASPKDKSMFVLFDGVYNNATFWLNGQLLGKNPYGYSPVYWDLTNKLKTDGSENILTVHVDHSRYADSRWYTGSGIYRNVKLVTVDKLHIPIWGTYLTTPEVSDTQAKVHLEIQVENQTKHRNAFLLTTKIFDKSGHIVAEKSDNLKVNAQSGNKYDQDFSVAHPELWDCDNPNMYKAVTTISKNGEIVDTYTTPFGIRSLEFKADQGFFLNEKSTLVKGVCLHHDGGLVGAAVPRGVWKRRLELLKEAGVNAIRTSHNPPSREFLDLCDKMGFLVQEEFFDELDYPKDKRLNLEERHDDYITHGYSEHFHQWAKSDLTRTMMRDRNHPCVFEWSIGNEIEWTYVYYRYITGFWPDPKNPRKSNGFWDSLPKFSPSELKKRYDEWDKGKYLLAETAKRINGWVKELDTTRPTTANMIIPQVSHVSGYADAVDIAGYSYRNVIIPWAHKYFPNKQVTINECPGTWDDWKQVLEYPGVFSMFMWTGIDYLGESNDKWPGRRPWGDLLDLAGFKEQGWNYFRSIWKDEPHLSIGTLPIQESGFTADTLSGLPVANNEGSYKWRPSNMHWNYKKGQSILVEVCSNYSTIELFLNGKSLGYRSMSESPDRLMRWVVPFEPGTLTAKAGFRGQEKVVELKTTSKPMVMKLSVDKTSLKADAYDVAHIVVQLLNKDGLPVKTENKTVDFEINGPAKLLGVDSGNYHKHQPFQTSKIETFRGRCLAIIQSTKKPGTLKVTVKSDGFESQIYELKTIDLNPDN